MFKHGGKLKRIFVPAITGIVGMGFSALGFADDYNYNYDYCYNNPYAYNCPCYNMDYYNYNQGYCPYYSNNYNNDNVFLDALLFASVVGVGLAIANSFNNNYYYPYYYPYYYSYVMPINPIYYNYYAPRYPFYPYNPYWHNYQSKWPVWGPNQLRGGPWVNPMMTHPNVQGMHTMPGGANTGAAGLGETRGAGAPFIPGATRGVQSPHRMAPNATNPGAVHTAPSGKNALGAPPAGKSAVGAPAPGAMPKGPSHQNFKAAPSYHAPHDHSYTPQGMHPMYSPYHRAPYRSPQEFHQMMMPAPHSFAPMMMPHGYPMMRGAPMAAPPMGGFHGGGAAPAFRFHH